MRSFRIIVLVAITSGRLLPQAGPVDSQRGERLFQSEGCAQCHSFDGKGGKTAPDLGKRIDRSYTPALLASVMWNHAPSMWSAMRQQGIQSPGLSEPAAA